MGYIFSRIPLLLRPKALAIKNYWRRREGDRSLVIRDAVIVIFGLSLMLGIYQGGLWVIDQLQGERAMVYFSPAVPLGLLLVYLFFMLILSNSATAISSLYLSNDLDLVLSSPLKASRFFWGKFLDTLLTSSWITMVFILPAIYSFARYYQAPLSYYFFSLAVLLPYFIIPTALSIVIVTIYSRLVSATRTKEALLVLSMFVFLASYFLVRIIFPSANAFSFKRLEDVLRLVNILSIPNTQWSPSYWATTCLSEQLVPSKESYLPHLVLLYSTAVGLLALSFLVMKSMHFEAYSRALSNQRKLGINSKRSYWRLSKILFFLPPSVRALIVKEGKLFFRDLTQLFQLVLLSGICLLYFYNFRIIHGIQAELPAAAQNWWGIFVFVVNTYIEAFLMTAVGTRFIFQTVSLEGRSYWILQASPLSIKRFLQTKLICWFLPVALVLGCVFAAGTYAVGGSISAIILKMISSWVICAGISGLGVGLGAYYANFSWEHTSQLAASFGSLVYMLACVALVSLDMALLGLVLVFQNLRGTSESFTETQFYLGTIAAIFLFVYLNYFCARWALRFGAEELERRRT